MATSLITRYDAGGAPAQIADSFSVTLPLEPEQFEYNSNLYPQGHTAGEMVAEAMLRLKALLVDGPSTSLAEWEHIDCYPAKIEAELLIIQQLGRLPSYTCVA
jgi:hypothetical protein